MPCLSHAKWELAINDTCVSAIPLPGQRLGAGAGFLGEGMVMRQLGGSWQWSWSSCLPPQQVASAQHTDPRPLTVLLGQLYFSKTSCTRSSPPSVNIMIILLQLARVMLDCRAEKVPEAGPRVSGAGLDVSRRAGPDPSLFPACFSTAMVARVNGQEKGCCLLGNDLVAIATQHLIAPFSFIFWDGGCLAGSVPLCTVLLTFNNPGGSSSSKPLATVCQGAG